MEDVRKINTSEKDQIGITKEHGNKDVLWCLLPWGMLFTVGMVRTTKKDPRTLPKLIFSLIFLHEVGAQSLEADLKVTSKSLQIFLTL